VYGGYVNAAAREKQDIKARERIDSLIDFFIESMNR
jgi:hypothetical protein